VVRATRNSALARVTWATVSFYERDQALPTDRDVREHTDILVAIRAGDPEAARAAMRDHLLQEVALLNRT
jgi:DNA-binding GntR family transcriptional regulator